MPGFHGIVGCVLALWNVVIVGCKNADFGSLEIARMKIDQQQDVLSWIHIKVMLK